MDDALRCLRDGAIGGRSVPFVLVQDTLDVLGGPALAVKLFSSLCKALRSERSQAAEIIMVPADESAMGYMTGLQTEFGPAVHQLRPNTSAEGALERILVSVRGRESTKGDLLEQASPDSRARLGPRIALGVDSVSTLMFHHPVHQVLQCVEDLLQQPALSCLLGTLHTDLHESITVKSLERMASCIVRALPAERLSHSFARNQQPDLAAEVLIKQRTGRVRVVTEYYQQLPDGALVEVKPLPEGERAAHKAQVDTAPARDAAGVEDLAPKMAGGMRLALTQQESAARQSVLLPWEARQAGAQSQDDFAGPAGLGSMAAETQVLTSAGADNGSGYGQVFYERDSVTDPDSDEDPDDDLDI
ncbi:hypothetical protein CVIRNUC_008938 [Coccomyxa viridis]|uniref:Elongator complex protein 5 n=1 Tax=Coccomyxa viridis TaxID=1274662 RepID=A0AAV1IHP7_9CHLO|nr:hypothetical protein CVIRNUC_008938 [Coccomyxa viridis]